MVSKSSAVNMYNYYNKVKIRIRFCQRLLALPDQRWPRPPILGHKAPSFWSLGSGGPTWMCSFFYLGLDAWGWAGQTPVWASVQVAGEFSENRAV